MSLVFDQPYEFVPPHRGNGWPSAIQYLRLVDRYLHRKEGVVDYECRGLDHFGDALARGDGILLAPNHCRYADPLVLGWPAREVKTHVYAMASWHLFNNSGFDSFALRKMGAFSINREAVDRQSLETAISALADAERPLILFPEGTTNRTNDVLKPLLDGVSFVARSAARRRKKKSGGQVVMIPVAIKYLCVSDMRGWADEQLNRIEQRLGWLKPLDEGIWERTVHLAEALLSLREIEYFRKVKSGDLSVRRDQLIEFLLTQVEKRIFSNGKSGEVRDRVRAIRTEIISQYFSTEVDSAEKKRLRYDSVAAELAQDLLSYPDCYLQPKQVTDTRIVETIQRMQETFFGEADASVPLKAVIKFDEPIVVPAEKAPRGQADPLLTLLKDRLTSSLEQLSSESRPMEVRLPNST
ncbi:MAG: 1-acyl-sn-glycerol-3-phosphate acyltransferase [Planctomycetaceae bacterium]|nr:1-acyl-sn-glycerol-3-phosphate acyltransferase [Planctomycetaceae bacterium]